MFLLHRIQGKAIIPCVNLVSNIGFGTNSTYTTDSNSNLSNLPRGEIIFPLFYPDHMVENKVKDDLWSKKILEESSILKRMKRKLILFKRMFLR